jgi:hypothetical protein
MNECQDERSSRRLTFLSYTLLQTSIPGKGKDLSRSQIVPWLVISPRDVFPRNGQPDGIGDSLAERTGGDFDTGVFDLGMTGGHGSGLNGSVVLSDLIHRPGRVPGEVEIEVLEETGVTCGEDET